MNQKVKLVLRIIVSFCILVLIADLFFFFYTKNKNDQKKTFFDSINGYTTYQEDYYAIGSYNNNGNSYEKAVLTKYDSKYQRVWQKTLNTTYNSTYYSIHRDGKYLLAVGSYEKTKEENEGSLRTALFVKYDLDGNVLFQKDLQILGDSKFTNLLVVEDGYIVVGQSIYPNDVLGNESTGGAIIMKYSKSGEVVWQQNIGGNKSGIFNDVIQVQDSYYAVGKDATRYGIVVQYHLSGEKMKAVSYAKTDTLGFSSIVSNGQSLFVAGAKKLNEDDEYDHDTDGLIVQYDLDLNQVQEVTYQDEKNAIERFNKIILDHQGNLLAIGHEAILDKENSTTKENVYFYQSFLVAYQSDLKKQKETVYDKDQDDYFTDIQELDGSYVVGGYRRYRNNRYQPFFLTYDKDFQL